MFFHDGVSFNTTLRRGLKHLLVPYLVLVLLSQLFYSVIMMSLGFCSFEEIVLTPIKSIILQSYSSANLPLWFLLNLFVVKLLYCVLIGLKFSKLHILLFAFIMAYLCNIVGLKYPYIIGSTFVALLYYSSGALLKKIQYKDIIFLIAILLTVLIQLFDFSNLLTFRNELRSGHYILAPLLTISTLIIIDNLFKRYDNRILICVISGLALIIWQCMLRDIEAVKPTLIMCYVVSLIIIFGIAINSMIGKKENNIVFWAGKNSMVLYLFHWPIFVLANKMFVNDIWLQSFMKVFFICLFMPLFVWFFSSNKFSWIIGK